MIFIDCLGTEGIESKLGDASICEEEIIMKFEVFAQITHFKSKSHFKYINDVLCVGREYKILMVKFI